jgi:4-amino-4-deoxy-L-arabinose transferase-like glycosyltransferase
VNADTLPNDFSELARMENGPRLGPRTGDQLAALGVLGDMAEHQAMAATARLPVYTGPVTGDQLGALGTLERAALGQAEHAIGAVPGPRLTAAMARRQRRGRGWSRLRGGLPLCAVLAVQAALSLRLVWSNTAFLDEADYIWAGHLEWAHWLNGASLPPFPTYFSGAPVVYPPLAAMADTMGGLAAARLLSLAFMLGTSALLWATAGRLYGRRAAYLSTALFAGLTGTQFLGAFATYDAMALFLLTAAANLGVRSVASRHWVGVALAAGVLLAGANATKYATGIFDPVVIAVVAAEGLRQYRSSLRALRASALLAAIAAIMITAAASASGRPYWLGIASTTLARAQSTSPAIEVIAQAWTWTGLAVLLAACAVLLSLKGGWRSWGILAILLAAGLLAPAEQARIHTVTSLNKHVVFGAWFAAIGAGYALSLVSRVDRSRIWAFVLTMPMAGMILFSTYWQANGMHQWQNTSAIMTDLRPLVASHPGVYLADYPEICEYYLRAETSWRQWQGTYPGENGGAPYYREAIGHHQFSLIVLANAGIVNPADRLIATDINAAGGYRVVARADGYVVWAAGR